MQEGKIPKVTKDAKFKEETEIPKDSIGQLIEEISKIPLFKEGEEYELFKKRDGKRDELKKEKKKLKKERTEEKIKEIDEEINSFENQAIEANLRFLLQSAYEYYYRYNEKVPVLDLFNVGSIGLKKAVKGFDYKKGYTLLTYATWSINQAISDYIISQLSGIVRLPQERAREFFNLKKIVDEITAKREGKEPSTEEIAEILGRSVEDVRDILSNGQLLVNDPSLDAPFNDEQGGPTLSDVLPSETLNPEQEIEASEFHRDIQEALKTLPEKEAEILRLYFGLSGERPHTLEEIGIIFGLTRERIRQIKEKALKKLRHPARKNSIEKLREHLDE